MEYEMKPKKRSIADFDGGGGTEPSTAKEVQSDTQEKLSIRKPFEKEAQVNVPVQDEERAEVQVSDIFNVVIHQSENQGMIIDIYNYQTDDLIDTFTYWFDDFINEEPKEKQEMAPPNEFWSEGSKEIMLKKARESSELVDERNVKIMIPVNFKYDRDTGGYDYDEREETFELNTYWDDELDVLEMEVVPFNSEAAEVYGGWLGLEQGQESINVENWDRIEEDVLPVWNEMKARYTKYAAKKSIIKKSQTLRELYQDLERVKRTLINLGREQQGENEEFYDKLHRAYEEILDAEKMLGKAASKKTFFEKKADYMDLGNDWQDEYAKPEKINNKIRNAIRKDLKPLHDKTYFEDFTEAIDIVAEALNKNGFEGDKIMTGIYTGDEGKMDAMIAQNAGIHIQWYRMPSGKYEFNVYVS